MIFFFQAVISIRVRKFPPFSNYSPPLVPFSRRKAHYNFCWDRGLKIGGAGSCKTERKTLFSVFAEKKRKIKLKENFIVLIILINLWHSETEFLAVIKSMFLFSNYTYTYFNILLIFFHSFWLQIHSQFYPFCNSLSSSVFSYGSFFPMFQILWGYFSYLYQFIWNKMVMLFSNLKNKPFFPFHIFLYLIFTQNIIS